MALSKETAEAIEQMSKHMDAVQKAAMHLCTELHNLQITGAAGNAALAMALAVSAKQSGMSKEDAANRFAGSLEAVYGARPTWQ